MHPTSKILVLTVMLAACGEEGSVRVLLTDAPLDGATAVNVTIGSVEVHASGGDWSTVSSESREVNLLELQGGVTEVLGDAEVPTGRITEVRLTLAEDAAPSLVNE